MKHILLALAATAALTAAAKDYTPLAPEGVYYQTNLISELSTINPETGTYDKVVRDYGYLEFTLPNVSTDGTELNIASLQFRVLVDNEPYIFQYPTYVKLEGMEPMEWIDDTFMDYYDFTQYSKDDPADYTKHRIYMYNVPLDAQEVGVQSRYKRGSNYYESEITNCTPYEPEEAKEHNGINGVAAEVASVQYFDLQGRALDANAKGIVLKHVTLTDGTTHTVKTIVR